MLAWGPKGVVSEHIRRNASGCVCMFSAGLTKKEDKANTARRARRFTGCSGENGRVKKKEKKQQATD